MNPKEYQAELEERNDCLERANTELTQEIINKKKQLAAVKSQTRSNLILLEVKWGLQNLIKLIDRLIEGDQY